MQELGTEEIPSYEAPGFQTAQGETSRDLLEGVERALDGARQYLFSIQHSDGHWCGELEGDTILESEYILTLHFLGRTADPKAAKAAETIRRQQLPQGGWAIYPGGPPEVSASVKSYFVLKLLGDDPQAPHMIKAREAILRLGGIEACNSFTKIYLALFGQYDWRRCPAVPPEMILLPTWFYFHIYAMSSWSRAIVVPLSIIWAHKPYCPVPEKAAIPELRVPGYWPETRHLSFKARFWRAFFNVLDRGLKLTEALSWKPLRRRSLKAAEAWILERLEDSDGLAAIFPPIVNTLIAFRSLGYPMDHPVIQSQIRELEKLEIEEEETLRVQPCFSSVWDTALALNPLVESGLPPDHPRLLQAARWILDREVRKPGDWKVTNPDGEVGGWYFEYANEFYPDTDDTAQVLTSLSKLRFPEPGLEEGKKGAMDRALRWLLSMQNDDGGWGAFDKGCDKEILTYIPFADHNAMIDPSCEDITGRTLETLACLGFDPSHPAVQRAMAFLRRRQEPDGTWYGRWGANYIYGTWLALTGLRAMGEDLSQEPYRRSAGWLLAHQNPDGGWGETLRSYDEPELKGTGESTPSQTAWALLGLLAAGEEDSPAVRRGLDFLVRTQGSDGSWEDRHWTATGFPKVFYLRYHLYATYFPLLALATYRNLAARGREGENTTGTMTRERGVSA